VSPSPVATTGLGLEQPRRRALLASALGLAGGGSLLMLTGCGGGSGSSANLRFVNATVDYASADFWAGGTKLSAALPNGGAISGWNSVDAADNQIELHASGSSTAKLTETHTFVKDTYTTALAYGTLATSLKFRYLDESDAAASSGTAQVRLFHAASALGALDVYITNTSSLSGLSPTLQIAAYEDLSSFVTLTSDNYRVRITSSGNQSNVLFDYTNQIALNSTAVITLVVVPRTSGSLPNLTALVEQGDAALLSNALAT